MTTFDALLEKSFENIVGKEENAGNHNVFYPTKVGMAMVTDFCNQLLGKPSDQVTGYSDNRQV